MQRDPPSAVQAAYAVQRALVAVRLEELRAALDAHEAARPLRRGHVTDMERVEAMFAEIVLFLTREQSWAAEIFRVDAVRR